MMKGLNPSSMMSSMRNNMAMPGMKMPSMPTIQMPKL